MEKLDKKAFIAEVKENVKSLYRKNLDEATKQQIFQAVSYAVKDTIIDNWMTTQQQYEEDDPKIVYYMSMEFLMGRALGNNLINLTAYDEVKDALEELGFDLECDRRSGAGCSSWKRRTWPSGSLLPGFSGNSGICRLMAAVSVTVTVCSNRRLKNGYQVEVPDNWLKDGNPFELRRPEYAKEVKFGGYVRVEYDPATQQEQIYPGRLSVCTCRTL